MLPQKKIYLILTVFGLVSIGLVVLLIYPLVQDIRKDSDILVSQKRELALISIKNKAFEQSWQSFQSLQPGIGENLKKFDKAFIDPEFDANFITFLEQTDRDSHLSSITGDISRVSIGAEKGISWLPHGYSFTCTGSFQNMVQFIKKLQNAPFLIEIQHLGLSKAKETKTNGQIVKGTFIISAYSLPKEKHQ